MQRRQPQRQAAGAYIALTPDLIAKRTKRHLDELEASNYAEPSGSKVALEDKDTASGAKSGDRTRTSLSAQRAAAAGVARKKSTMAVRTALLYRKTLATLLDESGVASYPVHVPTYLTNVAPPPKRPPRLVCSVCGYHGRYKCRKCCLAYCDLRCEATHNETRCERRVI